MHHRVDAVHEGNHFLARLEAGLSALAGFYIAQRVEISWNKLNGSDDSPRTRFAALAAAFVCASNCFLRSFIFSDFSKKPVQLSPAQRHFCLGFSSTVAGTSASFASIELKEDHP